MSKFKFCTSKTKFLGRQNISGGVIIIKKDLWFLTVVQSSLNTEDFKVVGGSNEFKYRITLIYDGVKYITKGLIAKQATVC